MTLTLTLTLTLPTWRWDQANIEPLLYRDGWYIDQHEVSFATLI